MTSSQVQPDEITGKVGNSSQTEMPVGGTGRFRIYLGAGPGVGKTYAMLNEGRRRKQRGADVGQGRVLGSADADGAFQGTTAHHADLLH